MDTMSAFFRCQSARASGAIEKVFDWDKAAKLIKERLPNVEKVEAGLGGDWEYTRGIIFENGEIVENNYTYLSSLWAIPQIDIDGEIIDCFIMANETEWDAGTVWPDSARAILKSM